MPEDRLAAALAETADVGRLVVGNPFRSAPVAVARRMLGARAAPFPSSATRTLHQPYRLRRTDPTGMRAVERACARYERSVRRTVIRRGLVDPVVITTHPLLAGFCSFAWASSVVYYAWDDWRASVPHRRWWGVYDAAYARIRDMGRPVAAISESLLARIAPTGRKAVLPNGVDPREWTEAVLSPAWLDALPRPRAVYVGSLDDRIDPELLRGLAARLGHGAVILVGPTHDAEHVAALTRLPGVHVAGAVDRHELAGVLAGADVGLVPHRRNAMTEAMSPLKLYEYLAAGLPVASVDLPPIHGVSRRVTIARDADGFSTAVEAALALGRASEDERLRFLREHSWERRFDGLLDLARGAVADACYDVRSRSTWKPRDAYVPAAGVAPSPITDPPSVTSLSHAPSNPS